MSCAGGPGDADGDPPIRPSHRKLVQQVFHPSLLKNTQNRTLSDSTTMPKDNAAKSMEVQMSGISQGLLSTEDMDNDVQEIPTQQPEWQRVPPLRTTKRKRISHSVSPPTTPTSNRFTDLPVDAKEVAAGVKPNPMRESRPPPLILYGIDDIRKLSDLIESVISRSDFNLKIITKNQLRVTCNTVETYKNLMSVVRANNLIGHTFTRKEEKCFRIVIKNLHHSTPHDAIVEELEKTGNKVRGPVINARVGQDKKPTSTFFVNLEPSKNNKCVKDIRYIYNTVVSIEQPRKQNTVVQCKRCQQYGHSKNNCLRPYRCVKCAQNHKTSECTKQDRNTPATCALCLGDHPANFKGCSVYQEIIKRRLKKPNQPALAEFVKPPAMTTNRREYHEDNHPTTESGSKLEDQPPSNHKKKYSDCVKGRPVETEDIKTSNLLHELIAKQSEKIDALLQQISTLVGLIATLVQQMTK
ncbi:hypothetical protein JYU34_007084 [Plutella xylostella]|uniref:Pre-C2HC domain-containing protein n=1 Tax=Plutella xylostella TaxID=51655 RepID=A0ABQ7QPI8_PLUXY|nr:hypothetical protein JYU34_007084 [Plutella xylostella]